MCPGHHIQKGNDECMFDCFKVKHELTGEELVMKVARHKTMKFSEVLNEYKYMCVFRHPNILR